MPQTLHEIYQKLFDIFLEFIFNWVSFICIYQIQQPHSEQMQPHTRVDRAWWAKRGLNVNSQLSLDLVHTLFTNCTTEQVVLDYKLFEGRYNVSLTLYFYSVEQMLIKCTSQDKHRFYKVIFQTCMSKEIFLDGEKTLPIALPWNLIQLSPSTFGNLGHTGIPASWVPTGSTTLSWMPGGSPRTTVRGMRHFHTFPLRITGRLTDQTLN